MESKATITDFDVEMKIAACAFPNKLGIELYA
jgi:hypothetical protein